MKREIIIICSLQTGLVSSRGDTGQTGVSRSLASLPVCVCLSVCVSCGSAYPPLKGVSELLRGLGRWWCEVDRYEADEGQDVGQKSPGSSWQSRFEFLCIPQKKHNHPWR